MEQSTVKGKGSTARSLLLRRAFARLHGDDFGLLPGAARGLASAAALARRREAGLQGFHDVDDLVLGLLCRRDSDVLALDLALDERQHALAHLVLCLLYTSDAADER